MSNVIAELVVNIGVTGEGGTEKALKNTKSGLGEVYSSSLATKAAIFGVIYGLERMMMTSAELGTSLLSMSAVSGDSTKDIQQIGWAAQQAGINAKEAEAQFVGFAQKLQQIDFGGTAGIQGIGLLQQALNTRGIDFSIDRFKADHKYALDQIQKGFQLMNIQERNAMLADFGLTGLTKGISEGTFNEKNYRATPMISEGQLKQLDKVHAKWLDFETHMQRIFDNLTAKDGGKLVESLDHIGTALGKVIDALNTLATKLHVFDAIAGVMNAGAEGINDVTANEEQRQKLRGPVIKTDSLWEAFKNIMMMRNVMPTDATMGLHPSPKLPTSPGRNPSSVTNHNQFNIHGENPQEIAARVEEVLQKHYNESASQDPTLTWTN